MAIVTPGKSTVGEKSTKSARSAPLTSKKPRFSGGKPMFMVRGARENKHYTTSQPAPLREGGSQTHPRGTYDPGTRPDVGPGRPSWELASPGLRSPGISGKSRAP